SLLDQPRQPGVTGQTEGVGHPTQSVPLSLQDGLRCSARKLPDMLGKFLGSKLPFGQEFPLPGRLQLGEAPLPYLGSLSGQLVQRDFLKKRPDLVSEGLVFLWPEVRLHSLPPRIAGKGNLKSPPGTFVGNAKGGNDQFSPIREVASQQTDQCAGALP